MKSSAQQPTLKDVARQAGVSQSTVSYVLNNTAAAKRISEDTKQRIWLAVEQLRYKSNPIGRALQRGYTNQVTLLIVSWNLANSHAATAMAISRAAAQHDLALTVHVADDDAGAEAFVARSIFHNLGGVLVLWDSPAFAKSTLCRLAAEGLPVIDLLPDSPDGVCMVTADREEAGYLATRHLLALGHKKIAVIADATTRPKTTMCKLAGYRRALTEAGVAYDQACIQDVTEFGFEGGRQGYQKLAQICDGFTALFCINDAIALGAIDAARDGGRTCPRDLSVVGYGDSQEGSHWRPKLTTLALSSGDVASASLKLVMERRRNPGSPIARILIPGHLIIRETTAEVGGNLSALSSLTKGVPSPTRQFLL
jgi:DNA-binding LacI/PurR family transcriptional regulator